MGTFNQLRNNLFSLASAELISKALGALLYIMLARYLGPHDFGIYATALSFTMVFGLIAGLGIDSYIIKEIAREKVKIHVLFRNSVLLKFFGGIIAFIMVLIFGSMMSYDQVTRWAIIVFAATLFFSPITNLYDSLFRGFQRMEYSALLSVARSLITIPLIVFMILAQQNIYMIVFSHVIASLLLVILFYVFIVRQKFCAFTFSFNWREARTIVGGGFPFIATGFVYIINAKADVLILSKLASAESVGIYDAANELFLVLLIIPSLLSQVLYPFLAQRFKSQREGLGYILSFALSVLISVSIPISAGLIILAPKFISLFYGARYSESSIVLQIMGAGLSIVFLRSVLGWVLAAIDKVQLMMWMNVLNLVLNVSLGFILVPRYMQVGAAIATISSMVLGTLVVLEAVRKEIHNVRSLMLLCVRPILATIPMAGFLIIVPRLNIFIQVVMGAAIYSLCFYLVGGLNRKEWSMFRNLSSFSE